MRSSHPLMEGAVDFYHNYWRVKIGVHDLHIYTTSIYSVLGTMLGLPEDGWIITAKNGSVLQEISKLKTKTKTYNY